MVKRSSCIPIVFPLRRKAFTALLSLLFFSAQVLMAQMPPTQLEKRLSKTWTLDYTEQGNQTNKADAGLNGFVMILNANHTSRQGMNPDGLINGTWALDEKNMMLVITDSATAQTYKMKIALLTANELVLEDPASDPLLSIHYKSR